jgi:hypothetical protein
MIRISITEAAFEALAATLPLGSVDLSSRFALLRCGVRRRAGRLSG